MGGGNTAQKGTIIMKIPKFVQDMMSRSAYKFDFVTRDENYAAGYTISIRKATPYTRIATFEKEIERLCKWVDREAGCKTAHILRMPGLTHYCNQYAIVTIFDPVMKQIEKYIHR